MKTNRFFFLPLMLIGTSAMAQTVSEDEAMDKALNFVMSQRPQMARGTEANVQLTLAHKAAQQGETYYYVFNNANDGGFVIIGGDESAEEVLGYCDRGNFDLDNLPDNFRWWLSTYEQSIHRAISAQQATGEAKQRAPRRAKANLANIEPLMKTEWGQDWPYNSCIPGNDDDDPNDWEYVTGCVATAASQIMKYYEWPVHGWYAESYQYKGTTYEANFAETTYDWANMKDYADFWDFDEGTLPEASQKAVGELLYHVGVASYMQYKPYESSATASYAIRMMSRFFGYKEAKQCSKSSYTSDAWDALVYSELEAQRPVYYSGRTSENFGHSFVCDGYKDGKFHINWGWYGQCNGYYLLTSTAEENALCPDGTGTGGADPDEAYAYGQTIFTGLEPDYIYDGGLVCRQVNLDNNGYTCCGCDDDTEFEVEFIFDNKQSKSIDFWGMLDFYDKNNLPVCYLSGETMVLEPGQTGVSVKVKGDMQNAGFPVEPCQLTAKLSNSLSADGVLCEFKVILSNHKRIDYTLTNAEWGTICLPYDAEVPDAITAYEVTGLNANNTLVLHKAEKLEMNKAYLINGTANTYRFGGPDTPEGVYQNGLLWGTTKNIGEYVPKGSYVLQNNPTTGLAFYQVTKNYYYKIKQYSAYLTAEIPAGARISIDEETGIQNVEVDEAEAAEIFNVLGQRTASAKGLVIKNGKLNFVK